MPALGAARLAAVAGGEDVERQRQRLQPEEQHDQVVRRAHHDRRRWRRRGTGRRPPARRSPRAAGSRRWSRAMSTSRGADRDRDEQGERVEGQGAADERRRAVVGDVVPEHHRQHAGRAGRGGRDDRVEPLRPRRRERADDEQEQRRADEHDHRREGEPVDLGPTERRRDLLSEAHASPSSTTSSSGTGRPAHPSCPRRGRSARRRSARCGRAAAWGRRRRTRSAR